MSATRIVVGFMPLLDCASLVASAECGFAAAEGLDLRLVRESSWANIRDRLIVGQFQAAHMLAPMSVACSLGVGHLTVPVIAPLALGTGGNAITVSSALHWEMFRRGAGAGLEPGQAAAALRAVVDARAAAALPPLVFAMVYPFSAHNYQLRYWLAAAGVDPDQDVRLVVIPPPLLVDAIRAGQIDGFCVGEPWNSVAVEAGAGRIVTTASRIWPSSAEKVLGLRADWAAANAAPAAALVRAVLRGALWCEDADNREELARLLAGPRYVGAPAQLLRQALAGELCLARGTPAVAEPNFLRLVRGAATFPWPGHALWFYTQMVRWRQIEPSPRAAAAAYGTYRPQLYRQAAIGLPIDVPRIDLKPERFFDGAEFDPSRDGAGHQRGAG